MLSSSRSHRRPGGPDLQRQEHWRGQKLASRDFSDGSSDEAERQWWHNRSLHDAYGVVLGLSVRHPKSGGPALAVASGLAYDAYGRELLLTEPQRVPPPRGAGRGGAWTLLLHRAGPESESPPTLAWRRSGEAAVKDGVPLVRGQWLGNGSQLVFERQASFLPPAARPLARPHLGEGSTPVGKTAWRSWEVTFSPLSHQLATTARGIEVTVSTAAAGFTTTPCYFAWLQGGLWQVPHRMAATLPLERITDPARDRFTFSLWDPTSSGQSFTTGEIGDTAEETLAELLDLARDRLYVCWLGVEPEPPPAIPRTAGPQIATLSLDRGSLGEVSGRPGSLHSRGPSISSNNPSGPTRPR